MNQELKEWTIHYVKNKDITLRKLVKYDEHLSKEYIEFQFKDKTAIYNIVDDLKEDVFNKIKAYEHKAIVCLNSLENFHFLIKNWKKFSEIKNLTIIFVNLKLNDKWVINPHTHSMIADPESIESGLKTMFDTANGKIAEVKSAKKKASMFEESSGSDGSEDEGEN